jgi:hypothetical protein
VYAARHEAFSMSEAAKIIETIFNNLLRKIAVKEAMNTPLPVRRKFFPSQCLLA